MKICAKCKQSLEENYFGKNKSSKDGLFSYCKNCCKQLKNDKKVQISEYRKIYYENNIEKF